MKFAKIEEYFKNKIQAEISKSILFSRVLCVENLNTVQIYLFNWFLSLNGKTSQKKKKRKNYINLINWYPN